MTGATVHGLLDAAVDRHGDRDAVVDGDARATYAELGARANRIAQALTARGVGAGDRVGLYLDKSIDAVAAIYGVLRSGAAYVPLDPHAPAARLGYIAGNCGLRCFVTGAKQAKGWQGLVDNGAPIEHLVVVDAEGGALGDAVPDGVHVCDAAELSSLPATTPEVAGAAAGRPRLHPLHLRLHRAPEGRHAHPPQRAGPSSTGRSSRSASPRRTGSRATPPSTSTCRSSTSTRGREAGRRGGPRARARRPSSPSSSPGSWPPRASPSGTRSPLR